MSSTAEAISIKERRVSHPAAIIAYLRRQRQQQAPTRAMAEALHLSLSTVSHACQRLQWSDEVEYVPLASRGAGIGVWRLKKGRP